MNYDGRMTGMDRGGRPLRRSKRFMAIIVRSGRPPRRLAVPAIGHMSKLIGRVRRDAAPVPAVSMAVIDPTGVVSFIDLLT